MFLNARKNINGQATKILRDIANAYDTGVFDDPQSSAMFCSLLACICEGKVQGVLDKESGLVKWSLTPEYSAELEELNKALLKAGLDSGRVVKGPWN